jgi:broad specificity phosphatase PhoE
MSGHHTLYLMRHGESEANAAHIFAGWTIDPALTAEGRRQAELQARALRGIPFRSLFASSLRRGRETARIVGRELGLEPHATADLREVGLGTIDGRSYDDPDLRAVFDSVLARWQRREYNAGFPAGETLRDLTERFVAFLSTLPGDGGPVLVVGHEVLFMAAIWTLCENAGTSMLAWRLGHGGIAVMARNGAPGFRLERFDAAPRGTEASRPAR